MISYSPDIAKELRRLPFHGRYERLGLTLEESDGWLVPSGFQPLKTEMLMLEAGCAVVDFSDRGVLELSGKDTIDFLHRISTNDFHSADSAKAVQTLLLNEKGRVLDSLLVLRREKKVLVIAGRGGEHQVKEWLERFIISDDVSVRDVTGELVLLARVIGRSAPETVRANLLGSSTMAKYFDLEVEISVVDRDEAVLTQLAKQGISQVGNNAYEVFRIENGIPRYQREISGEFNPLELNLRSQISFVKGCYIGQEIVARLDTYQKVQKRLCLVEWTENLLSTTPLILVSDGKEVGIISSRSPEIAGNRLVKGLAVIRKDYAANGIKIRLNVDDTEVAVKRVFES